MTRMSASHDLVRTGQCLPASTMLSTARVDQPPNPGWTEGLDVDSHRRISAKAAAKVSANCFFNSRPRHDEVTLGINSQSLKHLIFVARERIKRAQFVDFVTPQFDAKAYVFVCRMDFDGIAYADPEEGTGHLAVECPVFVGGSIRELAFSLNSFQTFAGVIGMSM